jgi:hypothetical protein
MDTFSKLGVFAIIGCICIAGLLLLAHQFDSAQADRDTAKAELVRAQTDYTRAESTAFQERYALFVSTLVALTNGITLYDLLLLALTAGLGFTVAWILKGGPAAQ